LIEIPKLGVSSISCLDNHVSVVDQVKVLVGWELGNNVERSLDIKTEVFAEFSLDWLLLPFIFIDNIEQLVDLSMLVVDNDVLVLSVKTT
jgi:hypothetical protein